MSPTTVIVCVREPAYVLRDRILDDIVPLIEKALVESKDHVRFEAVIHNQVSASNPYNDLAVFSIRQAS